MEVKVVKPREYSNGFRAGDTVGFDFTVKISVTEAKGDWLEKLDKWLEEKIYNNPKLVESLKEALK